MDELFDLVIIGAGSAGEAAALEARRRGATVAVVERELIGGECPFWSCMPSKSLLHAASLEALSRDSDEQRAWVHASARRDRVIERADGHPDDTGHERDLVAAGVVVIRGQGRIDGPGRVVVAGTESRERGRALAARAILVAVGSVPQTPPIDGIRETRPWTSREATTTRELPRSLAILGAGATGIELAQVFARFGVPTSLIAPGARIYPRGHPRNAAALATTLRADGVQIHTGARVRRARARAGVDGAHVLELDDGSAVEGHVVLLATGRTLPLARLGLETVGVTATNGHLDVGPDLRIAPGIFVAGDPATAEMHTHVAHYQGQVAARIALGEDVRPHLRAIPRAVYTQPEVAEVGLQVAAARAAGHEVFEETIDLAATARGVAVDATGHVTVVADRSTGLLLGAFIAGPGATEAIHEAVLAIRAGIPLGILADTIHAFPTTARVLSELFERAARRLDVAA